MLKTEAIINFSTTAIMSRPSFVAVEAAAASLTRKGFSIAKFDEHSVCLTGPGMRSTRQNPLLGASKIVISLEGNKLQLDAELGGIASMERFITLFPLILGLGQALIFCIGGGFLFGRLFGVGFGVPWAKGWMWILFCFCVASMPVLPWVCFSPFFSRRLRRATQNALTMLASQAAETRLAP